jgi:hypothetical protein
MVIGAPPVRLLIYYGFAEDWFRDAWWEAQDPNWGTLHSRRREIIFSVCFAEAYLFEWVFHLLDRDVARVASYFPERDHRSITERWSVIPEALVADGVLPRLPRRSQKHNRNWQRLIEFRNGLVHAEASWPEVVEGGRRNRRGPRPSLADFARIQPGWALSVCIERVRRLNDAAGRGMPGWITDPVPFTVCEVCRGRPRGAGPIVVEREN